MNDEMSSSSLITAAADGLGRGCAVHVRLDGELEWIEIATINHAAPWPGLFEVQRADGGTTLMAPTSRLAAIELRERGA